MSTTTQTPITKEALIELGFKTSSSDYGAEFMFLQKGASVRLTTVLLGDDIFVYLEEVNRKSIPFRNLKSIEQLKTIIEVCL